MSSFLVSSYIWGSYFSFWKICFDDGRKDRRAVRPCWWNKAIRISLKIFSVLGVRLKHKLLENYWLSLCVTWMHKHQANKWYFVCLGKESFFFFFSIYFLFLVYPNWYDFEFPSQRTYSFYSLTMQSNVRQFCVRQSKLLTVDITADVKLMYAIKGHVGLVLYISVVVYSRQ